MGNRRPHIPFPKKNLKIFFAEIPKSLIPLILGTKKIMFQRGWMVSGTPDTLRYPDTEDENESITISDSISKDRIQSDTEKGESLHEDAGPSIRVSQDSDNVTKVKSFIIRILEEDVFQLIEKGDDGKQLFT
jgi:hypothetical protein